VGARPPPQIGGSDRQGEGNTNGASLRGGGPVAGGGARARGGGAAATRSRNRAARGVTYEN
jgi:hypothetical protein